jgi:hypothetical protein
VGADGAGAPALCHLQLLLGLTERDNGKFKDLLSRRSIRRCTATWSSCARPASTKVSNWKHGWKLASSVGGVGTGERGDRVIIDDPHNVKESESKPVRQETIRWFRESMSSRLNNMETGAKVVIMQRVNEEDVSGEIIGEMDDWCHLLIPMEYVWQADEDGEPLPPHRLGRPALEARQQDCEGELAWPERFPERIIPQMKKDAGPFAWASQYQQTPETRGGAIFEREWWQHWEPAGRQVPGVRLHPDVGRFGVRRQGEVPTRARRCPRRVPERERLQPGHGDRGVAQESQIQRPEGAPLPGEKSLKFLERQRKSWGLIEWIADDLPAPQGRRAADRGQGKRHLRSAVARQCHPYAGWAIT